MSQAGDGIAVNHTTASRVLYELLRQCAEVFRRGVAHEPACKKVVSQSNPTFYCTCGADLLPIAVRKALKQYSAVKG